MPNINHDRTYLRVLLDQYEYTIIKDSEEESARVVKSNKLKKTKSGVEMRGGVVEQYYGDNLGLIYESNKYEYKNGRDQLKDEYRVCDWSKEL